MSIDKSKILKCPVCGKSSFRVNTISNVVILEKQSTYLEEPIYTEIVCAKCDSVVKILPVKE